MILATSRLAARVTARAVVHTLIICFSADVVGDGLGVLGCVGGDVVAADALVGEGLLGQSS